MNLHIIRNKAQLEELINFLREQRPPFKVAVQKIGMNRSIDANEYYWAVVVDTIAKATGHDAITVHEGYKKMFNFRYEFEYNKKLDRWEVVSTDSTATLDTKLYWNFIMAVRADAEIDLDVVIPMPNEIFTNQLTFDNE